MLLAVAKATTSGARRPRNTSSNGLRTTTQMVSANSSMAITVVTTQTRISLPSTGTKSRPPRATSPATMQTRPSGSR